MFENIYPLQRKILELLVQGYTNNAIAKRLGVKKHCVMNHTLHLYEHLDLTDDHNPRVMLVKAWYEHKKF